jgi:GTP pyrophosphokinase
MEEQKNIQSFLVKENVFELPKKATPIDFAYNVHTDIGNTIEKALINDKPAKLNQELLNGDIVEIIIDKERKYPNKEWLKSVKTKRAKEKIKQYSKKSTLQNITTLIKNTEKKIIKKYKA